MAGKKRAMALTGVNEPYKDMAPVTTAQALQKSGYSMDVIRQNTGHYQDITGSWMTEQEVKPVTINPVQIDTNLGRVVTNSGLKVGEYEAIPYKAVTNINASGAYRARKGEPESRHILINISESAGDVKNTAGHESTHMTMDQEYNGRNPFGGNEPNFQTNKEVPKIETKMSEVRAYQQGARSEMDDTQRFETAPVTQRSIPSGSESVRVTVAKDFPELNIDEVMGYKAPFPGLQKR